MTRRYFMTRFTANILISYSTVIKLKQVEHVRNERRTLADVSGHPFITSLIASFSDNQSLYMLVCLELINRCL